MPEELFQINNMIEIKIYINIININNKKINIIDHWERWDVVILAKSCLCVINWLNYLFFDYKA